MFYLKCRPSFSKSLCSLKLVHDPTILHPTACSYLFHEVKAIVTYHTLYLERCTTNSFFPCGCSNCKEAAHLGQTDVFILHVIMVLFVEILHEPVSNRVKFIIHQLLFEVKRWAAANNYTKQYFVSLSHCPSQCIMFSTFECSGTLPLLVTTMVPISGCPCIIFHEKATKRRTEGRGGGGHGRWRW